MSIDSTSIKAHQHSSSRYIITCKSRNSNVLGGKAYGTKEIRKYIESKQGNYTIPPKSNTKEPWKCDF